MIHPSPVRLVEKEAQRRLVLALECSSWAGSVDLQARWTSPASRTGHYCRFSGFNTLVFGIRACSLSTPIQVHKSFSNMTHSRVEKAPNTKQPRYFVSEEKSIWILGH